MMEQFFLFFKFRNEIIDHRFELISLISFEHLYLRSLFDYKDKNWRKWNNLMEIDVKIAMENMKTSRYSFLYWNSWQINLPSIRCDRRREWYKYPQITCKYLLYRIFGWIFAQGWLSMGGKKRDRNGEKYRRVSTAPISFDFSRVNIIPCWASSVSRDHI